MAGAPKRLTQADIDHQNYVFSRMGIQRPVTLAEVLSDEPIKEDIKSVQEEETKGKDSVCVHGTRKRDRSNRKASRHRRPQGPGC